jgi:hypothetical protein
MDRPASRPRHRAANPSTTASIVPEASAEVERAIDAKVARFAMRSAATLPSVEVYRDDANGHDICDVRGKVCS